MGSSLIVCGLITYKSSRPDSEKGVARNCPHPNQPACHGPASIILSGSVGSNKSKGPSPKVRPLLCNIANKEERPDQVK